MQEHQHAATLLSADQTADFLSVSYQTLTAWRTQGSGPAYIKVGRSIRYLLVDIESWLTDNRRPITEREQA